MQENYSAVTAGGGGYELANAPCQEHDHLFKFPKHKAKKFGLPEAIELYNDPGYGAYGLGVYHQMHCLNRIRKSFYPERYYPGESQHEVLHHTSKLQKRCAIPENHTRSADKSRSLLRRAAADCSVPRRHLSRVLVEPELHVCGPAGEPAVHRRILAPVSGAARRTFLCQVG